VILYLPVVFIIDLYSGPRTGRATPFEPVTMRLIACFFPTHCSDRVDAVMGYRIIRFPDGRQASYWTISCTVAKPWGRISPNLFYDDTRCKFSSVPLLLPLSCCSCELPEDIGCTFVLQWKVEVEVAEQDPEQPGTNVAVLSLLCQVAAGNFGPEANSNCGSHGVVECCVFVGHMVMTLLYCALCFFFEPFWGNIRVRFSSQMKSQTFILSPLVYDKSTPFSSW
jgi:hypothetical protein